MVLAQSRREGFESGADSEAIWIHLDTSCEDSEASQDQGLHTPWTLSSISWALGLLGYRNEKLLSSLARP